MIRIKVRHSSDSIASLSLGIFLCSPLLRAAFRAVFGSELLVDILNIIVLYLPVVILIFRKPKRFIKWDFIALLIAILIFFGITYYQHPEYAYVYGRERYGVWDYALIPYEAIYGYLFFRFIKDPDKLLNIMRISGYIMFPYFIHALINAKRKGYWLGVSGTNSDAKFSYSISFGYEVLFFSLIFFYCALKFKKKQDIAAFLLTVFLILSGGSRGPVLFLGIFFILYLVIELRQSKRKIQIITAVTVLFGTVYAFYEKILFAVAGLISKFGFSSRFITKLLEDDVTSDSGRSIIWDAAVKMIRNNPWGYGAMGSRHVIYKVIDAGYPHNIVLELLIDFGVVFGTLIILMILIKSLFMLFTQKYQAWKGVFLCMFCASCPLFLSMSYWGHQAFWAAIAICVNASIDFSTKEVPSRQWERILKQITQASS